MSPMISLTKNINLEEITYCLISVAGHVLQQINYLNDFKILKRHTMAFTMDWFDEQQT